MATKLKNQLQLNKTLKKYKNKNKNKSNKHKKTKHVVKNKVSNKILKGGSLKEPPFNIIRMGHRLAVYSVSFSTDGAWLVSGGGDKTVKVWNAITGECVQTLTDHTECVNSVSFSFDSNNIVYCFARQIVLAEFFKVVPPLLTLAQRTVASEIKKSKNVIQAHNLPEHLKKELNVEIQKHKFPDCNPNFICYRDKTLK